MTGRGRHRQQRTWLTASVVLAVATAGCGSSETPSGPPRTATARHAASLPRQPQTVVGTRLRADGNQSPVRLKPGTVIHSPAFGSNRVFLSARDGFALITTPAGEIYPGTTTNGGRAWKIAGPVFFTPTADGPNAVSTVTAIPPRTFVAFGAGNFVRVSTDGGKRWWQTQLGDETVAVVAADRGLVAFAQKTIGKSLRAATWIYRSTDGRHWTATQNFVVDDQ